jgi:hypothetical protein
VKEGIILDGLPLQFNNDYKLVQLKKYIMLMILISCIVCQYSFEQKPIMSRIADSNKASAHVLLTNKNTNKDIINMVESIPTLVANTLNNLIFLIIILFFDINRYNYIFSRLRLKIRFVSVGPHAPPNMIMDSLNTKYKYNGVKSK